MEQIAILGFGCAGYHCLKTLRAYGSDAQVDVYTDTDLPPCNPMLTTYYVKGKIPYEALFPFGSMEDIQKELHFTWFPKTLVEKLDASTKTLTLPDGTQRRYDKILLATGTHAFSPPVGDLPAERVFTMRTVRDATHLRDALSQHRYRRVLVTGAMMVGIKLDYKGSFTYFGKYSNTELEKNPAVKERIGYTGTGLYYLPQWTLKQAREVQELLFADFDGSRYDELCSELAITKGVSQSLCKPPN